jgi:hypothetical protein
VPHGGKNAPPYLALPSVATTLAAVSGLTVQGPGFVDPELANCDR